MTTEAKPPSLVRKLANVLGASERVPKNGFNKFHNYAYATEADISASVRGELAKQGVFLVSTVESVEWAAVTTAGGKNERLCSVNWLFTFLDADSPDKIEFRNVGQGQDSGDKAFYKAATGALKYALKMLFLIPTGDDPETDSPDGVVVDAAAEAAKAKAAAERAAGIQKMVAAFAAVGVDAAALDKLAGGPVASISNDTWARLRKEFAALNEKAASTPKADDPEETARQEVRAQAEREMGKPSDERVKRDAIFSGFKKRMEGAATREEVTLIGAEATAAKIPKMDLTAVLRAGTDRILALDEKKRAKPGPATEDVPF